MSDAQAVAPSDDSPEAPLPRKHQIETVMACRREMTRLYWAAKSGHMDMDKAKGLHYLLSNVMTGLKAEAAATDPEIAELLRRVKDRLK
jgi:hypothetical protein